VKRVQPADPKFNSDLVARVVRALMKSGKKTTAERIVYGAIEELREKTGKDPIEVMDIAIANMKPKVEVKSRRVGGTTYRCRSRSVLGVSSRWPCAGCRCTPGAPRHPDAEGVAAE
jgi:small subunit ribosomal protein S7